MTPYVLLATFRIIAASILEGTSSRKKMVPISFISRDVIAFHPKGKLI